MNNNLTHGFSLIELMVVIAIVAVLAAVAVPSYKTYIAKARILEAISVLQFSQNYINEYIAKNGKVPPSANFTPPGTSAYGTYRWEGQYGLSFLGNSSLHTPASGYLDIIYLRPHPDTTNGVIKWTCSVWNGATNPFTDFVPGPCQQNDTNWDYPEG